MTLVPGAGCWAQHHNGEIKDLLQIASDGDERSAVFRVELRSDAKEGMNEPALADHIALQLLSL